MTTKEQLKKLFEGVSQVRYSKSVITDLATAEWDLEFPTARDGFDFSQEDGTLNPTKVFGTAAAWSMTGESGAVNINLTIPTISDDVVKIFYNQKATDITSKKEGEVGATGTYEGKGYFMSDKSVEGSFMIVSESGKHALYLKHIRGYASLKFDDPTGKPMAIQFNAMLLGGNEECDFALLEWKPAT